MAITQEKPLRVLIFGASGIIGQHMMLTLPWNVKPLYARFRLSDSFRGRFTILDVTNFEWVEAIIKSFNPDVIVNLAGENNVDTVEREPERWRAVNVEFPSRLAEYCCLAPRIDLIHVSTQGIFDGKEPPYAPCVYHGDPVNAYGCQKLLAEHRVMSANPQAVIVRPTFVLGVRPMVTCGRHNPLEQMFEMDEQLQVNDRYFSPVMAIDVAEEIWNLCFVLGNVGYGHPNDYVRGAIFHAGLPIRTTRYDLAIRVDALEESVYRKIEAVPHSHFKGIAERPKDTTYVDDGKDSSGVSTSLHMNHENALQIGLLHAMDQMDARNDLFSEVGFAEDIALFLGHSYDWVLHELKNGFQHFHAEVANDFREYVLDYTQEEILAWYKRTEAYIWELACFQQDCSGFNYRGMCRGIMETLSAHLRGDSSTFKDVLVLGDGIGTLSLYLIQNGFDAHYHDLRESRTAAFASFRAKRRGIGLRYFWAKEGTFIPAFDGAKKFDCILALDYFEHLPNVVEWLHAVYAMLKDGGRFMARNAFAQGSGITGSIPCHLPETDHFVSDWDAACKRVGFQHEINEWYIKKS